MVVSQGVEPGRNYNLHHDTVFGRGGPAVPPTRHPRPRRNCCTRLPSELKSEIGADRITLGFENGNPEAGALKDKAKQVLGNLGGITEVVDSDEGIVIYAKNGGFLVPDIVRAFDGAGIKLASIGVSSPTLDDVFLKHTGRRIRPEEKRA